jgi:hypothetical protein
MLERSMWGSSGVSNGFEFIRVDDTSQTYL